MCGALIAGGRWCHGPAASGNSGAATAIPAAPAHAMLPADPRRSARWRTRRSRITGSGIDDDETLSVTLGFRSRAVSAVEVADLGLEPPHTGRSLGKSRPRPPNLQAAERRCCGGSMSRLINPGLGDYTDRLTILALKILFGEAGGKDVAHFRTEQTILLTKIRSRETAGAWLAATFELAAVNAILW